MKVTVNKCLLVSLGGLGFSSSINLAPSAFLASRSVTEDLLQLIMGSVPPDICYSEALTVWMCYSGLNGVPVDDITTRKTWSECASKYQRELLVSAADNHNKKRFLAFNGNISGAWLNAIPMSSTGLKLTNTQLRTAVASRLRCKMCIQHLCICGETVDNFGLHGLSCRKSASRFKRHSEIN